MSSVRIPLVSCACLLYPMVMGNDEKREEEPAYITPAEVASLMRVSQKTVYNWLRRGKLSAIRIDGTWRVARSELEPKATKE